MNNSVNSKFWWFGAFIIGLFIIGFIVYYWTFHETTNDAYVEGNPIQINALRDGFVTTIHTDDSFLVSKGQALVELDRTDANIQYNLAKDRLAETVRNICKEFHRLFALKSEVAVKRAEKNKARENFQHRHDVVEIRGVSLEDYQNAQDDYDSAIEALKATQSQYRAVYAFLQGESIYTHPLVAQAKQVFTDAWVKLYRSTVYSPVTGIVSNRHIQIGMTTHRNQPLMTVIPLDQVWINANFKETQLKRIRIGQKATVTSDYYGPDIVYHGRVVGIGAAAGNVNALLPPQNLSGNWIKIVQRLPVRIQLEKKELKQYPLRLGLSMHVTVNTANQTGLRIPKDNHASPQYKTGIYIKEKEGSDRVINDIIATNLDPSLANYAHHPLTLEQDKIEQ